MSLFHHSSSPAKEAVSQFVIPAKPRETGREPGSRSLRDDAISLDSLSTAGCENWPLQPAPQGGESFDSAQDREPVERPVEPRILSAFGGLAMLRVARPE